MAILFMVYQVFLEKEKMHRFNRWYLLGSIVFSVIVPLVNLQFSAHAIPVLKQNYFTILDQNINPGLGNSQISQIPVSFIQNETAINWITAGISLYTIISFILLVRFSRNIYVLLSGVSKNKIIQHQGARLVLVKSKTASYSFLNYIFINEEDYHNQLIENEIIIHELTHIRQKHSWDVIFIELLQIFFWLNPLLPYYKRAIQLNHEYLADEAVIKTFENIPAYQCLLLEKIGFNNHAHLTSSFNYSVTKKRFVMMTRTTTRLRAILKQLIILPLLMILSCLFISKEITAQEKKNEVNKTTQQKSDKQLKPDTDPTFKIKMLKNVPHTSKGISATEIEEYRALENKFISSGDVGYKSFHMEKIDNDLRIKMENTFKQMSLEQQLESRIIFLPPLGPSKAEPPTAEQLNKWKNADLYGVWIGDKKINNEELNNYTVNDFAYYTASKLYPNARKNVKYLVQVNLMKYPEFNQMNEERKKSKRFLMAFVTAKK